MSRLNEQLARLAELSLAELRQEWASAHKSEAPRLSPDLLRHGIAYRLQERSLGGLSARVSAILADTSDAPSPESPSLRVGTQLVRSWNGRTIAVAVTEDGFVFEERSYKSLSAIARAVTGAHWSGPRFFGLSARG